MTQKIMLINASGKIKTFTIITNHDQPLQNKNKNIKQNKKNPKKKKKKEKGKLCFLNFYSL